MKAAKKQKPLMEQVSDILIGRRDFLITTTSDGTAGPRLQGVQLRRNWRKKIWDKNPFSHHEQEFWEYYGQAVLIEEYAEDARENWDKEQAAMCATMRAAGMVVICTKEPHDIRDALGPVPENFDEYVARKLK